MSLMGGAEKFLKKDFSTMDVGIKKAQKILNSLEYDLEDIKEFSENLKEIKKKSNKNDYFSGLGIYLSLAINRKINGKLKIKLPVELDFVGLRLRKENELVVDGNVRDLAGYEMKGGKLLILGDAGNNLGNYMRNGHIECKNAGDLVGIGMEDGVIKVKGNAGKLIGHDMKGGELEVEKCENISPKFKDGKIKSNEDIVKSN